MPKLHVVHIVAEDVDSSTALRICQSFFNRDIPNAHTEAVVGVEAVALDPQPGRPARVAKPKPLANAKPVPTAATKPVEGGVQEKLLQALKSKPQSSGELIASLKMAPGIVYSNVSLLKGKGLIETREGADSVRRWHVL